MELDKADVKTYSKASVLVLANQRTSGTQFPSGWDSRIIIRVISVRGGVGVGGGDLLLKKWNESY